MGNFRKFGLLLWKNAMLQKRQPVVTALEILLPVAFFVVTYIVRGLIPFTAITQPVTWDSFQVDQFPPFLVPPRGGGRSSWNIAYSPNNSLINRVMANAAGRINASVEGLGFQTEEDLENFFLADITGTATANVLLGVAFADNFEDDNHFSTNITYKIRPKSQQTLSQSGAAVLLDSEWFTNIMYPIDAGTNGPREKDEAEGGNPGYYRQGFLTVQKAVDDAIILEVNQLADVDEIQLEMKRSPFPPYTSDDYIYVLQNYIAFTFILCYIVTAPTIVKDIALEKEKKLKETMKLMGLSNWLHWTAWFTKCFIFMFVITVIITILSFANNGNASFINYSNWFLIFIFFLLYATATIFFCFAVSAFFSKASTGAAGGGILFLLTYLPYLFIQFRYYEMSTGEKMASSLLHNVALCYGCYILAQAEGRGVGLQWDNFYKPVNAEDNFTFGHVLLMLVIDCFVYAMITWYVDAVYPGDFGIPKPLYFPFMKSYWCGESVSDDDLTVEDGGADLNDPSIYEKNFARLLPSIRIRSLRKVFGRGKATKVAVEGLNLDIYEDQITALLGHNGAGKTTTMFMLTGFIPPSSGGASVYGYDIRRDTDAIRESLGYCPQHDILFDTLTVYEHMYFFAKLRGIDGSLVENEINVMLKKLNLENKRNALSSSLSGGMKRRLSVGIAFLGNTKIVILDEPTSGMDPEARRQIWDILEWERKGRTIILSTHFMEEADYLGDRVAIMAQGKLQCCGSSLFLKSKYGIGYHMRIVKTNECDVSKVTAIINSYVPLAKLENNVSTELTYVLPRDSAAEFATLFTALEENKKVLGITSFGASLTTLEEVFLKVGEIADQADADAEEAKVAKANGHVSPADIKVESARNGYPSTDSEGHANGHSNGHSNGHANGHSNGHSNGAFVTDLTVENGMSGTSPTAAVDELCLDVTYERNHGATRALQQFCAMLLKRIIHTWKNRVVTAVQLLVPFGFTLVICIVIETLPKPTDPQPLLFNLDKFKTPVSPYALYNVTAGDTASDLSRVYSSYLTRQDVRTPMANDTTNDGTPLFIEDYLVSAARYDVQVYIKSYLTAATFESNVTAPDSTNDTWTTRVWSYFNNEAYHSPAISLTIFSNTLMQYFTNASFDIYTLNHPLPRFDNVKVRQTITQQQLLGANVSANISFGMAFLIATFVLFLVKERACGAKHLQFVAGVHVANFWMSTFVWDFINFMIPSFLLLAVFAGFQLDAYSANSGIVLLLFVLFAWSVLPSVYLLSFLFSTAASAFVWIVILDIFTGITAVLIVSILTFYESTYEIAMAVEWIFYIFLPNYCFGQSLQNLYINHETLQACNSLKSDLAGNFSAYCILLAFGNQTNPCCENNCGDECASYNENYFAWENPGIGRGITFMALQGIAFFFCLFLLESQVFRRFWQKVKSKSVRAAESRKRASSAVTARQVQVSEEDEDVSRERDRILSNSLDDLVQSNAVVLRNLRKLYDTYLAVKGLTFAIPRGECFGLLGVNGAGKTTTFKMLSGDETISDGDAYLAKSNISKQVRKAQQKLGYCPQFDGIVDQMTVTETLVMYARLRGIREADIGRVVDTTIKNLLLQQHAHRQAQLLSGGNKRKLCTAIALVGDPPIICLDEPTTGMDPGARRYLWKVLTGLREKGRTIILTSHSMEECEALCSRIGIMVNGQLKCLGSSQHLKTKFGDGYTAIVKLHSTDMDSMQRQTKTMMDFVESTFPGSTLKDKHNGLLHYQIPSSCAKWSTVFAAMEQARTLVDIDDYAVSEVTLEQIFIGFAREQVPPEVNVPSFWNKVVGCCCCCCLGDDESQHDETETHALPYKNGSAVSVDTKL